MKSPLQRGVSKRRNVRPKAPERDGEAPALPRKGPFIRICLRSGSGSPNGAEPFDPAALFAFKEIQDCLRLRLGKALLTVLTQTTGVGLELIWHDPLGASDRVSPRNSEKPEGPRPSSYSHWDIDLESSKTPPLGAHLDRITHLGVTLRYGGFSLVTLVLRTLLASSSRDASLHDRSIRDPQQGNSRATLHDAADLLELLLHDLEVTVKNHIAHRQLENTRRTLKNLEKEEARLRKELHNRFPDLPAQGAHPTGGNHAQQIVQQMVDWLRQNYQHPISLSGVAVVLKMNATYLCSLFSRTTGVTFHKYLDELRINKAKELLADPLKHVSEVARASGYTSGDYFRQAFRAHTGSSPSRWREGL